MTRLGHLTMLVVIAGTVTGCLSAAQDRSADETACQASGLRSGTAAFASCVRDAGTRRVDERSAAFGPTRAGAPYRGLWLP